MVRMQAAHHLLQQFEDEGDAFLKSIVTTDETWVHLFIPKSQQSSREWRHTSSPKPKTSAEEPFGRKSDANVLLGLAGGYPCRLSDRCQNSQCSLLLRHPGTDMKEKIRPKRKTGGKRVAFLQDNACPHTAKQQWKPSGNWKRTFWHIRRTVPIWAQVISTCSEGSNQTCKACSLRTTTPSSRLFGSGYTANHKPFLKRASGCFQNVGKNVLTPEVSTLKTDMCKYVFVNYGYKKKISPGHIWTTLY